VTLVTLRSYRKSYSARIDGIAAKTAHGVRAMLALAAANFSKTKAPPKRG